MATPTTAFALTGLASRLVRQGLIDEAKANEVNTKANEANVSFITQIFEESNIDTTSVAQLASEEFGVPFVDVSSLDIDGAITELVSEKIMTKHQVLPLYKRGTKLFVAVTDPLDTRKLDEAYRVGRGFELPARVPCAAGVVGMSGDILDIRPWPVDAG